MPHFTFETDRAPAMPAVVGASNSSNAAPLSELQMGCIAIHLNTAMKHTAHERLLPSASEKLKVIHANLLISKSVVMFFKMSRESYNLPEVFALPQESEACFGTAFDVVQRIMKSFHLF